jgi:hypothetical protein
MARDEHFFAWPPSSQLALACFPYLRVTYQNLYRELFGAFESKLDRKLRGLPEPGPTQQQLGQDQDQRHIGDNNAEQANEDGRGGGIIRVLQAIVDVLAVPDVQVDVVLHGGEGDEDVEADEVELLLDMVHVDGDAAPAPDVPIAPHQPLRNDGAQLQLQQQQPAQPAPAAAPREHGLRASLIDVANAVASALLLPGISFGMGQLLKLALPKSWTTSTTHFGRFRVTTGLLQEQWGRSLVGGCMYAVLRDVFRLYTKYRRVRNQPLRKVRNVERKRAISSS